jgi:hypothetical protein
MIPDELRGRCMRMFVDTDSSAIQIWKLVLRKYITYACNLNNINRTKVLL